MKLSIPLGSEIVTTDNDIIKIHIKNTRFSVLGKRIKRNLWNIYLVDPESRHKELIREHITTRAFAILSNMTLKTPFPYVGKRAKNVNIIKRFIKREIKKYEQINKHRDNRIGDIIRKSSTVQDYRKRFPTSKSNLSTSI